MIITIDRHNYGLIGVFKIKMRPIVIVLEKFQFYNCSDLIASHCIFVVYFPASMQVSYLLLPHLLSSSSLPFNNINLLFRVRSVSAPPSTAMALLSSSLPFNYINLLFRVGWSVSAPPSSAMVLLFSSLPFNYINLLFRVGWSVSAPPSSAMVLLFSSLPFNYINLLFRVGWSVSAPPSSAMDLLFSLPLLLYSS